MSTEEKKISVIPFSGLREEWDSWNFKFLTKAQVKGYEYLFDEENEVSIPEKGEVIDESTEEGKKKAKIKKDNATAISDLTLSMNSGTRNGMNALMLIKRTKTKDKYPLGNARVAWQKLKERYESKTSANQGNLQDQFYALRCKTYQSPEAFINQLEDLRNKLEEAGGIPISDQVLVNQVLNHLPPQYSTQVYWLRKQMDKGEGLEVQGIIQELEEAFQANRISRKNSTWDETALVSFGQGYKGKCTFCGHLGHKKSQCRLFHKSGREQNEKRRNFGGKQKKTKGKAGNKKFSKGTFEGTCFYCNKKGHKKVDCYKMQRELDIKEKAMVAKEEMCLLAADTHKAEEKKLEIWGAERRSGEYGFYERSDDESGTLVDSTQEPTYHDGTPSKCQSMGSEVDYPDFWYGQHVERLYKYGRTRMFELVNDTSSPNLNRASGELRVPVPQKKEYHPSEFMDGVVLPAELPTDMTVSEADSSERAGGLRTLLKRELARMSSSISTDSSLEATELVQKAFADTPEKLIEGGIAPPVQVSWDIVGRSGGLSCADMRQMNVKTMRNPIKTQMEFTEDWDGSIDKNGSKRMSSLFDLGLTPMGVAMVATEMPKRKSEENVPGKGTCNNGLANEDDKKPAAAEKNNSPSLTGSTEGQTQHGPDQGPTNRAVRPGSDEGPTKPRAQPGRVPKNTGVSEVDKAKEDFSFYSYYVACGLYGQQGQVCKGCRDPDTCYLGEEIMKKNSLYQGRLKLMHVFVKAGMILEKTNLEGWASKSYQDLHEIGIVNVWLLCYNLATLNDKLHQVGKRTFTIHELDCINKIGLEQCQIVIEQDTLKVIEDMKKVQDLIFETLKGPFVMDEKMGPMNSRGIHKSLEELTDDEGFIQAGYKNLRSERMPSWFPNLEDVEEQDNEEASENEDADVDDNKNEKKDIPELPSGWKVGRNILQEKKEPTMSDVEERAKELMRQSEHLDEETYESMRELVKGSNLKRKVED